ncbi:hypothetical protein [Streptomyces sp. NPDC088554]|uniref:hypothetical protein n=1 Tax=Streptomyces sp. NPDC088554 TaxID=3365865 RepID=UPI0037FCFDEA
MMRFEIEDESGNRLAVSYNDGRTPDGLISVVTTSRADATPAQARAVAAALFRAADEAEWAASGGVPQRPENQEEEIDPYPIVTAVEMRSGDVLNDKVHIVAEKMWMAGGFVNVRWTSGGDHWTNTYQSEDRISLIRRGPLSPNL